MRNTDKSSFSGTSDFVQMTVADVVADDVREPYFGLNTNRQCRERQNCQNLLHFLLVVLVFCVQRYENKNKMINFAPK